MTSREPSVVPSSRGDTVEDALDDIKLQPADIDDTASDLPARTATPSSTRGTKRPRSGARKPRGPRKSTFAVTEKADGTEDESTPVKIKKSGSTEPDVKSAGTAVGTRRQANGTVGSVYSGSKIRHIKKPDGIPLWRKEIQYAFLDEVVHNEEKCFTRISDGQKDCTFSDIYIDCMARSSKTSKILKDRLYVDRPAAQNMSMICLLVNVGRMNTTLNFFPEMRAQLRTYHPIPSLQAHPDQKDYKGLQDAPRLKSILKGASEDEDQPRSLSQLRSTPIPRTNPVNLIFVLSQAANEISQLHFLDKIDFFDLAVRSTITSHSRATAFLWLMWWYLESDFSKEAALNNPFGPGEYREDQDPSDPNEAPLLVPKLQPITEEEGDAENVDLSEEIEFGAKMTEERKKLNAKFAEEEALAEPNGTSVEHKGVKRVKRTAREMGDDLDSSDVDSSRASPGAPGKSPAPMEPVIGGLQADSLEDDWEPVDAHPGRGRYKRVRGKNTPSRIKMRTSEAGGAASVSRQGGRSRLGLNSDRGTPDTGRGTPQPMPPGVNHPILTQYPTSRLSRAEPAFDAASVSGPGNLGLSKSRARTGYQRELEHHRQRRVEWLVNKKRRGALKEQRERRERTPQSWLLRTMYRVSNLDATYDSDEDESGMTGLSLMGIQRRGAGLGGLLPNTKPIHIAGLPKERSENSDNGALKKGRDEERAPNGTSALCRDRTTEGLDDPYGEEPEHWKRIFLRTQRRLYTWSGDKDATAYHFQKARDQQRTAMVRHPHAIMQGDRALVDPSGQIFHEPPFPPSSVANSTPRKPKHEPKKSLDEEITMDLLAERSADEADEDMEDDEGHSDVAMAVAGRPRTAAARASDVEMD